MARIMIVDDELDLTELYRMTLESQDHRVVGIFDDPNAAVVAGARGLVADVIILDERLKGLSGISFLPALRKAFPGARILFASADPDAVDASVRRCADLAWKKPFAMRTLARLVFGLVNDPPPVKKCI